MHVKVLGVFVLFSFLCVCSLGVINLPKGIRFPAVIVFGDSLVDTGNNNYLKTIAKCNYPPYGDDFEGGAKPTGRFSNGKVPPDFMAEELGVKQLVPPYLDPSLKDEDLLTGVNFASGASGYDPLTSQIPSVLSLSDQLKLFKDYIEKVKKIGGDEKVSEILKESLFTVATGPNDITNTYILRSPHYDLPSYVNFILTYASTFVQDLHKLGARRILVLGLPPLGCLPSQRTLRGGSERKCVQEYNDASQLFNVKLKDELHSLNVQSPDAVIAYGDAYNLPLDIFLNPLKYGFKIGDRGCCGTGTIEVAFLCKCPCSNVSEFVFWDSFHPTQTTYKLLVHEILNEYIKNFV